MEMDSENCLDCSRFGFIYRMAAPPDLILNVTTHLHKKLALKMHFAILDLGKIKLM